MKKRIKYLLIVVMVVLILSQFQPLLLRFSGAVDGTFGVRPTSHQCLGLTVEAGKGGAWLPPGNLEFRLGLFHFRYTLGEEGSAGQRPVCVGQDIWFGE